MSTLRLVIKKDLYDKINSDELNELSCQVDSYWIKRLCDNPQFDVDGKLCGRLPITKYTIDICKDRGINLIDEFRKGNMISKDFTCVNLRKVDSDTNMDFTVDNITISNDDNMFVIKLGEKIQNRLM